MCDWWKNHCRGILRRGKNPKRHLLRAFMYITLLYTWCFVKVRPYYVHNKVMNIPFFAKITYSQFNHFSWVFLFFGGVHSSKSAGISGQATSLLFCLCLNFPFKASSCVLSQRDASSQTLSQNTNKPGLGESNRLLNSLLYRSITLLVRWWLFHNIEQKQR